MSPQHLNKAMNKQSTVSDTATATSEGRKRSNYRFKAVSHKDKRRQDAEARQRDHDSLSKKDKIAKAKSRRGESKKEIARLTKGLEWDKAQKVTKAASVVKTEKPLKK